MRPSRAGWKTLLLALFWALSLAAFSAPLTGAGTTGGDAAVAWTRTASYAGVWLIAAVALGLGYRLLERLPRALGQPRLWILAFCFAAVLTLGESFAQTGTAALVTGQKMLALLYFAGRVPACYLGMALMMEALSHRRAAPAADVSNPAADEEAAAIVRPRPVWAVRAEQAALGNTQIAPSNGKYAPPVPEWAARREPAVWTPEKQSIDPVSLAVADPQPAQTEAQVPPETFSPLVAAEQYRCPAADIARGAWAPHPGAEPKYLAPKPVPKGREGLPTAVYALLLFLCWLPYLVAVWPGTVSNDSITQLAEILGVKALENGNPLAQTGLIWLAVQVGQGLLGSADAAVTLYVSVQAALLAWLLGYTLRRMADMRAPRWLTWLAGVFYALCPVFPVFAFCMGKDTVFAMAVLWFTLMVWRMVESKRPPLRTVLGLCLSAAACALLRNAGAALAGITLLVLLIRAFTVPTRQWQAPLIALAAMGVALGVLYIMVVPSLQAQPAAEAENWSVPLQQVARVAAGGTLSEEEKAVIDAVLPVEEIRIAYNGELSDPVKALWRPAASAEAKSAFFGTWLRLGVKYPATYLSAFFHNSYGYLFPGYVSTIKPTFLLGMEGRTTLIDGQFDFTVNPAAETLKTALRSLFAYVPFRLLCAPGLYGWLALLALAGILGSRQRRNAVCLLPGLLALAGCLFSAVNGYFRYAMPLYFMAPLLLALLAQALFSGRRARNEKKIAA
ncbi:MAG: DUF6020 family protein [Eubacteriales bacterium]|nr:DUF6020 family protein [Eubacteriales bacterium]